MLWNALLVAVLAVASPNASAPTTSKVGIAAPNEVARDDALALAQVIQPFDAHIAITDAAVRAGMDQIFRTDTDWLNASKKDPGLRDALLQELSRVVRQHGTETMPGLHRRYARFYAQLFSADEISELYRLYSSSFGQKLIAAKTQNIDLGDVLVAVVDNPEAEITEDTLSQINRESSEKAVRQFSVSELRAGFSGFRPATILKLQSMQPRMMAFEAEIANEPDPQFDALLLEAFERVLEQRGVEF